MNYIVGSDKLVTKDGITSIAINATAVVYTHAMKLRYAVAFAMKLKLASSGTPDVKIQIEEGTSLPTTEGSADSNWAIPDGMADVYSSLTDKVTHIKQISPVCAQYIRFKITGNASNPADTVLTGEFITQQPV